MRKPLPQHQPAQRLERSGSVRAFAGQPTSVDEATRSFDIVITTETPVRRWLPDPRLPEPIPDHLDCSYVEFDEVLVASGVDLSRTPRMPLIDCHDTYSGIEKILGKIDDVRVEGTAIVGRASLARKHAELLPDIIDGYFGQISAGYDYDIRRDTEVIERPGDVPILRVTRWLLTEGSLVPVGADPNSFIRSAYGNAPQPTPKRSAEKPQEKRTMDITEVLAAAEAASTAAEEAVVALEAAVAEAGDTVSEEIVERARGLRGKIRAEEEAVDDATKPEPEAEGARAEGDEKLTPEEEKEVSDVRSVARSYGKEKLVSDMRSLGAKPSMIRKALVKAIADGGASTVDKSAPVVAKPAVRSALSDFNPAAVFAARNKR